MLESLFTKAADLKTYNVKKRDSNTGIFPWNLQKF